VLAGAYVFLGGDIWTGSAAGVLVTLASGAGWAVYLVAVGRLFARRTIDPLAVSAFAMASGTVAIAGSAAALEGFAPVTAQSAAIILWLGVVNTAAAFFLWNHALTMVDAFEVAMLQNTMLIQIAVLSWVFLGETLTAAKALGMALVLVGVLAVQTAPVRGGGRS
jgi:drug/metabolite transporter (DMT)-like permease